MPEIYQYSYLAASALIKTGPGVLHSVTLTGVSDAATVVLGDEVATAGDSIIALAAAAGVSASAILDVAFGVGLYATITGTAPKVTVSYR
ncbi:MAG: hypothetical protein MUP86_04010 [Dehalococcoidia bacterium]|nr:hypothetical protein [Dehalococcoidia bacterium]